MSSRSGLRRDIYNRVNNKKKKERKREREGERKEGRKDGREEGRKKRPWKPVTEAKEGPLELSRERGKGSRKGEGMLL